MKLLRINKWNETFENADSRKRQRLGYFLCPSGVDSAGYIELMTHGADGITAYAVMLSICQWSATCVPLVRGTCARSNGRPLTVTQLAMHLRMPAEIVSAAVELLTLPEIGWMEWVEVDVSDGTDAGSVNSRKPPAEDVPTACQSSASHLPPACHKEKSKSKEKSKEKEREKEIAPAACSDSIPFPEDDPSTVNWISEEASFIEEWNAAAKVSSLSPHSSPALSKKLGSLFQDAYMTPGWRQRARDALGKFPLKSGIRFGLETFLDPHTADRILAGEFNEKFNSVSTDHKPKSAYSF